MTTTVSIFERCALWPIRIDLASPGGYTIWGNGGLEIDLLLASSDAANRRLLVFPDWPALRAFIRSAVSHNLSALPQYPLFAQSIASHSTAPTTIRDFPVVAVRTWLGASRWRFSLARCALILDCINLLGDAARTLDDPESLALLGPHTPLSDFADALTFLDESTRLSTLSSITPAPIRQSYTHLLTRIIQRTGPHAL